MYFTDSPFFGEIFEFDITHTYKNYEKLLTDETKYKPIGCCITLLK